MLTKAQIGQMWANARISFCLDKVPSEELAFAREVEAATLATVTPLVQQMQSALQNLLAAVRGECPGLLDEDRGGSAYLGMDADDVIAAAGAWLSPQVGDKGDGNAQP